MYIHIYIYTHASLRAMSHLLDISVLLEHDMSI